MVELPDKTLREAFVRFRELGSKQNFNKNHWKFAFRKRSSATDSQDSGCAGHPANSRVPLEKPRSARHPRGCSAAATRPYPDPGSHLDLTPRPTPTRELA